MSYRILLVEDCADSRELLAEALRAVEGFEVITAPNGFEALRLLPRHRFDLIITDTEMPDIDGFELANFMKKSPPYRATPLVMISSAGSTEEHRTRGMSLGASDYLVKPIEPTQLAKVVKRRLTNEVAAV